MIRCDRHLSLIFSMGAGDGPSILYSDDGREISRMIWSKGELVEDQGEKVKIIFHDE